jgi:trypsin
MIRLALALLAAALASPPAAALLIRPDRDDTEYLELATRYTSSVLLGAPDEPPGSVAWGGEGVLIAPRWVLTAAHMARALQEMKALPRLAFGGRGHEIQAMFLHPDWTKGGHSDVALILLKEPVRGIEPTPLYRGTDESGKTVVIVGHGLTGKIGEKPLPKERWDRKQRASINTVDRVTPRILGMRIKNAEEASDLQGAAAPGDSGGPAYLETAQGLFVAGIGYATDDANADGIVGNAGDWELYARVSAFVPWIEGVILEEAKREMDKLLDDR